MKPEDWQRVSAIFHEALQRPQEDRRAYLEAVCGTEGPIRDRVERLLVAQRDAGRFGEQPLYSDTELASLLRDPASGRSAERPRLAATMPAAGAPRGARLFLGVAFAAAAVTFATFAYAAWLLVAAGGSAPLFGWNAAPHGDRWIIGDVAPDGPAAGVLRPGDRLLGMRGTPPGPDVELVLHRRGLGPGDAYTLTIEREGLAREVRLVIGSTPNTQQLIYFLVSLVWCAVGLFIGFARPEAALARIACAAALATGLVFLQIAVIRSGLLWQPLHGVLGFHFLARFPTGEPTRGGWRVALVLAYATGGLAALLGLSSHALVLVQGTPATLALIDAHASVFGLRWTAALFAFALAVLGMVLALVHNYRRLEDEDHRQRIRWLFYGAIVGLAPQLWWTAVSLLDTVAGPTSLPRLDLLANSATVVIPLTMAYVIVKHRVLDIRVVVRRGLQYLLARNALQAITALPFLALLYELFRNRDLTLRELATQSAAYLVWLALAACVLWFRRPIARWLDRRFFREEFDREQLMTRLLDASRRVESLSELSELINDTLSGSLHPAKAFVWYRDPREQLDTDTLSPELSAADFPPGEGFLDWIEQQGTAVTLPALERAGLFPEIAQWLSRRGIAVIVPMADSGDRLIGALLLGGKLSEEPYDASDAKLLENVAKQMAVIRENLRLRARLSEEVRVRHDVLARLDERLPDLLRECPACGSCYDGPIERCPHDDRSLMVTLPVRRTIDDRYRLDRMLGRGGMGAVYEARDLRLERRVAVKIMLSKGFRQLGALRRFRREARAAARVSHPNIVTVHDFGSLDGEVPYLVMERIDGETLRAVLDRDGTLTLAAAREWFAPLLDGVAAAHASGIVHRDLKPENIMGTRNADGTLDIKILDLGLAKLRGTGPGEPETMTQEGLIMGTPHYMSPEQLAGRDVDARSDIFAIGAMLLEALTARCARSDDARTGYALLADLGDAPLPEALRALLASCLAVDPDARPDSAHALARRLLPLLHTAA